MDVAGLLRALMILAILGFLIALGIWAVRYGRKGTGRAGMLGAALLFFGFGNMLDPTNEAIHQAKESKKRKEGESGDPPAPDE